MKRRQFSPKSSRAPSFRLSFGEWVGYHATQSARSSRAKEKGPPAEADGPFLTIQLIYRCPPPPPRPPPPVCPPPPPPLYPPPTWPPPLKPPPPPKLRAPLEPRAPPPL